MLRLMMIQFYIWVSLFQKLSVKFIYTVDYQLRSNVFIKFNEFLQVWYINTEHDAYLHLLFILCEKKYLLIILLRNQFF